MERNHFNVQRYFIERILPILRKAHGSDLRALCSYDSSKKRMEFELCHEFMGEKVYVISREQLAVYADVLTRKSGLNFSSGDNRLIIEW